MAIRLVQRRGLERRTYELDGTELLATRRTPFARVRARLPAELLFGARDEVRTFWWPALALAVVAALGSVAAILDEDRAPGALVAWPAVAVVSLLVYRWSALLRRRFTLADYRVAFLAGPRHQRALDAFLAEARAALRATLRAEALPFRVSGNLVTERLRVEWWHQNGVIDDDERADLVARIERMTSAAIAAGIGDDGAAPPPPRDPADLN